MASPQAQSQGDMHTEGCGQATETNSRALAQQNGSEDQLVSGSEELKAAHISSIPSLDEAGQQAGRDADNQMGILNEQTTELKDEHSTLTQQLTKKLEELEYCNALKYDLIKKITMHIGQLVKDKQFCRKNHAMLQDDVSRLTAENDMLKDRIVLLYSGTIESVCREGTDNENSEHQSNTSATGSTPEKDNSPAAGSPYTDEELEHSFTDGTGRARARAPSNAQKNRKPPLDRSLLDEKVEPPRPKPLPELRPCARPGWTWVAGFWRRYPIHWGKVEAGNDEGAARGVGVGTTTATDIEDPSDAEGEESGDTGSDTVTSQDESADVMDTAADDVLDANMAYEFTENEFSDDDLYNA